MGLFDRFRRSRAASDTFRRDSRYIPRWTSPPARNTAEWIQAFNRNPRLAVVDRIASDLSFATGKLYQVTPDGEEQEVQEHLFFDFWESPNPLHEMSNAAVWRLFEIYLKLKGEGYLIIEKDIFGRPAELWPVPTHWVQMTPYAGHPFYSVRMSSGMLMEISVDDMFVMKDLNPFDPYMRGLGQSEPLADEIETDEYAAKFQKRFFYNDATPNIIVAMPNSSDDQRKRFRAQWKEKFQGVDNSHEIATVNGDATVTRLGDNMRDLEMVEGRTFLRNSTLEHFGVPREIMGITESSNRATSEAAQYIYAQNVLMPNLRRREQAINKQLIPLFGDNLVWHYDDIVPHNQEFDKAKALDGWNNGLLTKNEARELMDLPPTETGGDVYKTQFSDIYMRADEDPAEASAALANLQYAEGAEPVDPDGTIEVTDDVDTAQNALSLQTASKVREGNITVTERKAARLQAVQRTLEMAKRTETHKFETAAQQFFRAQAEDIKRALNGGTKDDRSIWDILLDATPEHTIEDGYFFSLDASERQALVDQFVLSLIDWTGQEETMKGLFEPLWCSSYGAGVDAARSIYRIPGINRPELVSTAKLRGGARIKGITQTTQQNISRIVSDALETGTNRIELQKQIQNEMQTTTARARTIAAQECNNSLMSGHYDMMREAGGSFKTWHTILTPNTRDSHRKLNGVIMPIDKPFVTSKGVELRYPCDPKCTEASEVVNCHCFITMDDF